MKKKKLKVQDVSYFQQKSKQKRSSSKENANKIKKFIS